MLYDRKIIQATSCILYNIACLMSEAMHSGRRMDSLFNIENSASENCAFFLVSKNCAFLQLRNTYYNV